MRRSSPIKDHDDDDDVLRETSLINYHHSPHFVSPTGRVSFFFTSFRVYISFFSLSYIQDPKKKTLK